MLKCLGKLTQTAATVMTMYLQTHDSRNDTAATESSSVSADHIKRATLAVAAVAAAAAAV